MEDARLRAEFHRAYDAVIPSAPWLTISLREHLREVREIVRPQAKTRTTWLIPAVAVLLAIAIVATLAYMARSHPQRNIPILPPRAGQAPEGCPPWITGSNGGQGRGSAKMTSSSTGWIDGALRTTDGGAHWRDVTPPAMRADAPSRAGLRPYPPSYADFFLDSNHAWVARTYSSVTSCFEKVTVFVTSDGGRTWAEPSDIVAPVQADTSMQLQLNFIDPLHGWLMVLGGGRLVPDSFIYSTADGGHHWKLVAPVPYGIYGCAVTFISLTTGYFAGCPNTGYSSATMTVTRDGGKTWNTVRLPEPIGTRFSAPIPVFFDQNRGVARVNVQTIESNSTSSRDYLVATTDGGRTWLVLPDLPQGYGVSSDFLDPNHFWVLLNEGGKFFTRALYGTSDGGKSWTLLIKDLPALQPSNPQVFFIDPRTGFIFEPSQQFGQAPLTWLVTSDGGRSWKEIHPQIS